MFKVTFIINQTKRKEKKNWGCYLKKSKYCSQQNIPVLNIITFRRECIGNILQSNNEIDGTGTSPL